MAKRKNDGSYEDESAPAAPLDVVLAEGSTSVPDGDAGGASVMSAAPAVPTMGDVQQTEQQIDSGEAPRAAPKAGEGANVPPREVEHPELEPPVPPTEYRVAPTAPGDFEREEFGDRPSLEEIEKAQVIVVQTVDKNSGGVVVGGVVVTPRPQEVIVQTLLNRTRQHLLAIATDPRIQVKLG